MIIKQYYLGCLAHASYIIADERTRIAAVVDPQRDIDQYLEDAQAAGWNLQYVFLTHFHADFLAGHIELRNRTGAHIYLGASAQAEYDFTPVKENDVIEFGDVRIKILETPGHTPEGISLLVYDLAKSASEPQAILTGDTLFIGDVGRPDLLASIGVTADELGQMLYDSIQKLVKLPDHTIVYPAHGAGSLCGKQLSKETSSTLGQQKRYNYALQPMSRDDFIKLVTADQPEAPDYFIHDALTNRRERPALDESLKQSLRPLPLETFLRLRQSDCQVLDVREPVDFEGAHLEGALNIGLKGQYATWAGTMLSHDIPILLIAEPGDEEEAIMRLGRIGFDNVAGYLETGMSALEDRPDLLRTTTRATAPAVAELLATTNPPLILDVRTPAERQKGHLENSLHIPLNQLASRLNELPKDGQLVIHCQSGYRSAIAASLLQKHGWENLLDLVGGYNAWVATHLPTTVPEGAAACSPTTTGASCAGS